MSALPSGTVTFLFSDIEGSTRLLQQLDERWGEVLADHRRLVRDTFARASGREVDTQGDAFFFVFPRARDAVAAAAEAQRRLAEHEWTDGVEVRVRMGLHTGEPAVGEEGYLGLDVVRAARICSAAHGGQVLLSETTRALLGAKPLEGATLRDLGEHTLKDLDHAERVYQLILDGVPSDFPPVKSVQAGQQWGIAGPPLAVAGREDELASRTLAAVKDLGRLADLGPSIERTVAEQLRAAGVTARESARLEEAAGALDGKRPRGARKALVFAGVAILLAAVAIVLTVYLIGGAL